MIATLPWQIRHLRRTKLIYEFIYARDLEDPNQFTAPFYIGAATLICCCVYAGIALILGGVGPIQDYHAAIELIARGVVFWALLYAKALFGPLFAGYLGSIMVLSFLQTGSLIAAPFVTHLLDWVFFSVSPAIQIIYSILITFYGLLLARGIPDLHPFTVR